MRIAFGSDLFHGHGPEAGAQIAINLAGNGGRKVIAAVCATRYYHYRKTWIIKGRVRSEESDPLAMFDAGAGFSGHSFIGIESAPA